MSELAAGLAARGFATLTGVLSPRACRELAALWEDSSRFRKQVIMQKHGFGRGEYRYWKYPLPEPVQKLRESFYAALAPIASAWRAALGASEPFPDRLDDWLARCRAVGQAEPTPLLLRYEADDYNCLHQDVYGELVFPIQATLLLSDPARDFTGGEFLLVEQRPRRQSRGEVVPLAQGDAVFFAVRERPRLGARGVHRVQMRHGVSRVRSGRRQTLGLIFHDAR